MDPSSSRRYALARVAHIYEKSWAAYHAWKKSNTRNDIRDLLAYKPSYAERPSQRTWPPVQLEPDKIDPDLEGRVELPDTDVSHEFSFFVDADGDSWESSSRPTHKRVRCVSIEPGPAYEACDTLIQPLYLGTHEVLDYPRALPFADRPGFEIESFIRAFAQPCELERRGLSAEQWLDEFRGTRPFAPIDPDFEFIELETIRRASKELGLTLRELDALSIFSRPLLPTPIDTGFSSPRIMTGLDDNISAMVEEARDVLASQSQSVQYGFDQLVGKMCTRIACLHGFCNAHPPPRLEDILEYTSPASVACLQTRTHESCGQDCFTNYGHSNGVNTSWTKDEVDKLRLTVGVCKTLSLCEIAVLMEKPCSEVFHQRLALEEANPAFFRPRRARQILAAGDATDLRNLYTVTGCNHDGPCTPEFCYCARMSDYCSTNCSCGEHCGRQYPGCNCHAPTHSTRAMPSCTRIARNCLCVRRGRECQPGVCKGCKVEHGRRYCGNAAMGTDTPGKYLVAETDFGFGLFAREHIGHNKLIGEYIGECIAAPRADAHQIISKFVDRNYLFEWIWFGDLELSLDALEAGNATRFINHPDRTANAEVRRILVNGDLRLGIYAKRKIKKNEEIFLSYGPNFFLEASQKNDEDPMELDSPARRRQSRLAADPS
ncbi:hypothetical protein BKA62DRAFT_619302 [Auriculariales sp. MPI-PUGE-AT-0066]|nr:hypothetical protein BKA62DRAFT_619302 [Auriculariales sp. MPI-PUGE-AT-0066]